MPGKQLEGLVFGDAQHLLAVLPPIVIIIVVVELGNVGCDLAILIEKTNNAEIET